MQPCTLFPLERPRHEHELFRARCRTRAVGRIWTEGAGYGWDLDGPRPASGTAPTWWSAMNQLQVAMEVAEEVCS